MDHGEIPLGFCGHKCCSGQRIVEGLQMGKIPSIHCEWSFLVVLDKSVQKASSMNPELRHMWCARPQLPMLPGASGCPVGTEGARKTQRNRM